MSSERSREAPAGPSISIGVCSPRAPGPRPPSSESGRRPPRSRTAGRWARPLGGASTTARAGRRFLFWARLRPCVDGDRATRPGRPRAAARGREKRAPLTLRHRYDAGAVGVRGLGRGRATEQIEVEARVGVQTREQTLPAAQHAVDLLGRTPIDHRGRQPAGRDQLARTGQAGAAVLEPAPVGQLLGQRAGRLVVPELRGDPHRPLRITRCHGSSAHLPGSKRDG